MKTSRIFYFLLINLLFSGVINTTAQGWVRTLNNGTLTQGITEMPNGDIIVCDAVVSDTFSLPDTSFSIGLYNLRFSRFDPNGKIKAQKIHKDNTSYSVEWCDLTKSNSGDIITIFNRVIFDAQLENYSEYTNSLLKLNSNFDFGWESPIPSFNPNLDPPGFSGQYERILKGKSGGYFLIGKQYRNTRDSSVTVVKRYDENGEEVFTVETNNNYDTQDPTPVSFCQKNNGDFLMAGHRLDSTGNKSFLNYYLPNGDMFWEKTFPGRIVLELIVTDSDEIYVFTSEENYPSNHSPISLLKLDNNGNTLIDKLLSPLPYSDLDLYSFHGFFSSQDNTIIYALPNRNSKEVIFNKIDLSGEFVWQKSFDDFNLPSNLSLRKMHLEPSTDGGFLIFQATGLHPFLIKVDSNGDVYTNEISGRISINYDTCLFNPNFTLEDQVIIIEDDEEIIFTTSNSEGEFSILVDTGSYKIYPGFESDLWEFCQDTFFTNFQSHHTNDTIGDFTLQELVSCPILETTISSPFLRRCFSNTLHVNYCNNGTITAEDAYVEVNIDPRLTVTGSTIPWTSINGSIYTFDLGDIEIFECGDFQINTLLECDSVELGQTLCLEAHIYPDSICTPPDPLWNGSDLRISGYCDGDSVRFIIKNEGAALPTSQDFIIIEDDMVMRFGTTNPLAPEETFEVAVEAEGSTYRLQMDQVPGHPWSRIPGVTIENCGQNGIGGTNTGFVTMYEPDDSADFLDIECIEVRGSYDPNDKEAFPKGVCASHFINDDTELEYKIRFQNVGNDTAFTVVIRDTLSTALDPTTIEPMVASHAYTWALSGTGVLTFTFDNIDLVDAQTNEPESHGFIKYRISQKPGNPVDTKIENKAAIYFDFNPPIITNTVEHLVGEGYLMQQGGNLNIAGKITRDDGLPLDSVKVYLSNNCVTYTNQDGDYLFPNLEAGLDYRIWAEKDEDHANGLTFLDILEYRKTILNFDTLQSVYRYFVGDVNGSQTVTTFDLVLTSKVMAQEVQRFPNVDHCWLFFDATGPYPQTRMDVKGNQIEIKNLQADQMDNNFRAAKLGDLIYEDQLTQVDLNQTLSIGTPPQSCSNLISLPVVLKGDNLEDVKSVSFLVDYDPAQLEIFGLGNGNTTFPDITTILHGNPGKKLVYFDGSGTFKNDIDSLIVGYIYFVPIAEENEPVEVSVDMNNLQAIVETVQQELSIFDVQNSNFLLPAYADLSLNVTAIDIPCDNIGATVCITDQLGNEFASYQWNTGETTSCIALNNSMTVQCWVTDNNGCQNLMSSPVNVVTPDPVAIASVQLTNASAANATDGSISNVVVVGGVGPYTFLWSTGATTTAIFNLAPGYYEVTITDANGCKLVQGYTISYPTSAEDIIANISTADIQPNPVKRNELSILEIQSLKGYEMELEIRDISGRLLSQQDISVRKGKTRVSLEPQKAAGLYLVSLTIEGKAVKTLKWSVL
jgi:hypothetical protein